MFWDSIMYIAIAIYAAILFLGRNIYFSNPRKDAHRYFFVFTFFFSFWLMSNFLAVWLQELQFASYFLLLDFILAPWFLLFLFFFLASFPTMSSWLTQSKRYALYAVTFAASALVASNLVIHSIEKVGRKIMYAEGPLFLVYVLVVATLLFSGIYLAARKSRKLSLAKRKQAQIVLGGMLAAFTFIFVGNVFLQNILDPHLFIIFNLSSVILPLAIGHSIVRYHFMGLKKVFDDYLVFITLFATSGLFFSFIAMIPNTMAASVVPVSFLYAMVSALFVMTFLVVQDMVKTYGPKILGNRIEPKHVLKTLLPEITDKESGIDTVSRVIENIELVIGAEPTIMIFDHANNTHRCQGDCSVESSGDAAQIHQRLCENFRTISKESLHLSALIPQGDTDQLLHLMERHNISYVIPVIQEQGEKNRNVKASILLPDFKQYTKEEINFLEMLAPQLPKILN